MWRISIWTLKKKKGYTFILSNQKEFKNVDDVKIDCDLKKVYQSFAITRKLFIL